MDHFGDDEASLDAYLAIASPVLRVYADEGKFRSLARSMWLSGNKEGFKRIIVGVMTGPTLADQEKEVQEELRLAKKALDGLVMFQINNLLGLVGFRKGDILTVQGSDGKSRNIVFDGNLPALGQTYEDWFKEAAPDSIKDQLQKMFG
jgi:hypothetical protein